MVPSPAGTSIVFRGRPSTIPASTVLPFNGPSSSTATTVVARGCSSGGIAPPPCPSGNGSHRGRRDRTRGDTELHIESTPRAGALGSPDAGRQDGANAGQRSTGGEGFVRPDVLHDPPSGRPATRRRAHEVAIPRAEPKTATTS